MTTLKHQPIIGFMGKAGSGKDTCAELSRDIFPKIHTLAFADPLRELTSKINPIVGINTKAINPLMRYNQVVTEFGYNKAKVDYPEIRSFLQNLGTSIRELPGQKDFFTNQMYLRIMNIRRTDKTSPIIITDVRFENEAKLVKEFDGLLIDVIRNDNNILNEEQSKHISEQKLDIIADEKILNYSNLTDLFTNLKNIYSNKLDYTEL